jgi:hypothetical protein
MAEVRERVRLDRVAGDVRAEDSEVHEAFLRAEQIPGERGNGEEGVTGTHVLGVDDGRCDRAEVESDREPGGDDERGPEVACREHRQRPPPADAVFDGSDDDGEEHDPQCELGPAVRPERAADENADRHMGELVEVRAERQQQVRIAGGAGTRDQRGRGGEDDQVRRRQRRRQNSPTSGEQRGAHLAHGPHHIRI